MDGPPLDCQLGQDLNDVEFFGTFETLSDISFIYSSGESLSQPLRDDINVISVVFVYFRFLFS